MEDLESRLGQIMADPDMMGKIMSLAQNLNLSQPESPPPQVPTNLPDMALLQQVATVAGNSGIDPKQKNLLRALEPYLPMQRLQKLEKAMQAAKMARLASGLFGERSFLTGR